MPINRQIIKLIEKRPDGAIREISLDQVSSLKSAPGTQYTLVDTVTGKPPAGMVLKRVGQNLVAQVAGEGELIEISNFYGEPTSVFQTSGSVSGASAEAGLASGAVTSATPVAAATSEVILSSSAAGFSLPALGGSGSMIGLAGLGLAAAAGGGGAASTGPVAPILMIAGLKSGETTYSNTGSLIASPAGSGITRTYTINDGAPSGTYTAPTVDGSYTVKVTDTDSSGKTVTTTLPFVLLKPFSAATVGLAEDTGTSSSDKITSNAAVNFGASNASSLTGVSTRKYFVDGVEKGSYVPGELAPGRHTVEVVDSDLAGNVQRSSVTFTLLSTVAQPDAVLRADTGTSAVDGITNDAGITLGSVPTGVTRTIRIYSGQGGGKSLLSTTSDGSYTAPTTDGTYTVEVSDADAAGNSNSKTLIFTLDKTHTAADLSLTTDSGTGGDKITNSAALTVAPAGSGVTRKYFVDSGASSDSYTAPTASGQHTVRIEETDVAGNKSEKSITFTLLKSDSLATPTVTLSSDAGSSSSDRITNDVHVTVSTLAADVTRSYTLSKWNGSSYDTVSGYPKSSYSEPGTDGQYKLSVTDTDLAGNSKSATDLVFTLDTTLATPTATQVGYTNALNLSTPAEDVTRRFVVDGTLQPAGKTYTEVAPSTPGRHTVEVIDTDTAGNTKEASVTFELLAPVTAPLVELRQDTGTSNSDLITNKSELVFSTAPTGITRTFTINGGSSSGTYTAPTSDGIYTVLVRDTNAASDGASTAITFTLDKTHTAPDLALLHDTAAAAENADKITNDASLNVAAPGSGVTRTYYVDSGAGSNTYTAPTTTGQHTVRIDETDTAGNTSSKSITFTLLKADSLATPTVVLSKDTGSSSSDGNTNDVRIDVSTTAEGVTRSFTLSKWNGSSYDTVSGYPKSSYSEPGTDGQYKLVVTDTDLAGNSKSATDLVFTRDTTHTAPDLVLTSDTAAGSNNTDKITNNAALTVDPAGSGVTRTYYVDSGAGSNTYTAPTTTGDHTVRISEVDLAGNTSEKTITFTLLKPESLATPTAVLSKDSGSSSSDGITNDVRIDVSTPAAGVTRLYSLSQLFGANYIEIAAPTGTYTAPTDDGSYKLVITDTDLAGNTKTSSDLFFTKDTTHTAPDLVLDVDSGIGGDNTDKITNNAALDLAAAGPGITRTYYVDSAAGSGTYTAPTTTGDHTVRIVEVDTAGNTSEKTLSFKLLLPESLAMPTVSLKNDTGAPVNDTGIIRYGTTFQTDHNSIDPSIVESTPATGVTRSYALSKYNGTTWDIVYSAQGSYTPPAVDGEYKLVVTDTDVAGNVKSTADEPLLFTLNTYIPPAPTFELAVDTGKYVFDDLSKNPQVNVTKDPGSIWEYSVDGGATWTKGEGISESVTFTLAEGEYAPGAIHVRQIAPNGQISESVVNNGALEIDMTGPDDATVTRIVTNHISQDAANLSGTGEPFATVDLIIDGNTLEAVEVDANGNWTVDIASLAFNLASNAHYDVTVVQTDTAGNATETTLEDSLWLVDPVVNLSAGSELYNSNWAQNFDGVDTLDFGDYVHHLQGVDVAGGNSLLKFAGEDMLIGNVTQGNPMAPTDAVEFVGVHLGTGSLEIDAAGNLEIQGVGVQAGDLATTDDAAVRVNIHADGEDLSIVQQLDQMVLPQGRAGAPAAVSVVMQDLDAGEDTLDMTNSGLNLGSNGWLGVASDVDLSSMLPGLLTSVGNIADINDVGDILGTLGDIVGSAEGLLNSVMYMPVGDIEVVQTNLTADTVLASDAHLLLVANNFIDLSSNMSVTAGVDIGLEFNSELQGSSTHVELVAASLYSNPAAQVLLEQSDITADVADLSDAHILMSAFGVRASTVHLDQSNVTVGEALDVSNAAISVNAVFLDLAGDRLVVGAGTSLTGTQAGIQLAMTDYAPVVLSQISLHSDAIGDAEVTRADLVFSAGINADNAHINVMSGAPMTLGGVELVQSDLEAVNSTVSARDASIDISGYSVQMIDSNAFVSTWMGNTYYSNPISVDLASVELVQDDITATDVDVSGANIDIDASHLLLDGITLSQSYITGSDTVSIADAHIHVGYAGDYFGGYRDLVAMSGVTLSQDEIHATGEDQLDGSIDASGAGITLDSQPREFNGFVYPANGQALVPSVLLEQSDFTAAGDIDASGASVELNIGGAAGTRSYVSRNLSNDFDLGIITQGDITSEFAIEQHDFSGEDINVSDAHVAINGLDGAYIDLVDHLSANPDNFTREGTRYITYLEQVETDVKVVQSDLYANSDITATGVIAEVNVGDDGLVSIEGSIYVEQDTLSAVGDIVIDNATARLTGGTDSYLSLAWNTEFRDTYVGQLLTSAGETYTTYYVTYVDGLPTSTSGPIYTTTSPGDTYYGNNNLVGSDVLGVVGGNLFVYQNDITAGGSISAVSATAEVFIGTQGYGEDGAFSAYAVGVSQTDFHASGSITVNDAQVSVESGDEFTDISVRTVSISQVDLTAGSDVHANNAEVEIVGGEDSDMTFTSVFVEQVDITAASIELNDAQVHIHAGDGSDLTLFGDTTGEAMYVWQYEVNATNGDIEASNAEVLIDAGDYVDADLYGDVSVEQESLTASGNVLLENASAGMNFGLEADVRFVTSSTRSGLLYVEQHDITAGGDVYATGAEAFVDAGDGSSLTLGGVYVAQYEIEADGSVTLDNASATVAVGEDYQDGATVRANFVSVEQMDVTAVGDVYANNALAEVSGGEDSELTVSSVLVEQYDITAASIELNYAEAHVYADYSADVTLSGNTYGDALYVWESDIRATDGDILATNASALIEADDYVDATLYGAVYVGQYSMTASGDVNLDDGSAGLDFGSNAYISLSAQDATGADSWVYVEQNDITAGGDVHAARATAFVDAGDTSQVLGASGFNPASAEYDSHDNIFVQQANIHAAGSVTLEGATARVYVESLVVNVPPQPPAPPALVSLNGSTGSSVYVDQEYITATGGDIHAHDVHATVDVNGDLTLSGSVYVAQDFFEAGSYSATISSDTIVDATADGTIDFSNVLVSVDVAGDATIGGDLYIIQGEAYAGSDVQANGVLVEASAIDLTLHDAYIDQNELTAGGTHTENLLVSGYFGAGVQSVPVDYAGGVTGEDATISITADTLSFESAYIAQYDISAGESIDFSGATVEITAGTINGNFEVYIDQSDMDVGGVLYDISSEKAKYLGTTTYEAINESHVGDVDLTGASISIHVTNGDLYAKSGEDSVAGEDTAIGIFQGRIRAGNLFQSSATVDLTASGVISTNDGEDYGLGVEIADISAQNIDILPGGVSLEADSITIYTSVGMNLHDLTAAGTVNVTGQTLHFNAESGITLTDWVGISLEATIADSVSFTNNVIEAEVTNGDLYAGAMGFWVSTEGDAVATDNLISLEAENVTLGYLFNILPMGDPDGMTMARNDVYVTAEFSESRALYDFNFTVEDGVIDIGNFYQLGDDADATFWGADVSIHNLDQLNPDEAHVALLGQEVYVGLGSNEVHIESIDVNRQNVARLPSNEYDWWSASITIHDTTYESTLAQTLWIDDIQVDYAQAFLYFDAATSGAGEIVDYDYHVTISDLGIAVNNINGLGDDIEFFADGEDSIDPSTEPTDRQWDVVDLTDLGITSADQLTLDTVVWGNTYGKDKGADKQIVEKIDFHYTDGDGHHLEMSLKDVQLLMKGQNSGGLLDDDTPADNEFWDLSKGSVADVNSQIDSNGTPDTQLEEIWRWIYQYSLHLDIVSGSGAGGGGAAGGGGTGPSIP